MKLQIRSLLIICVISSFVTASCDKFKSDIEYNHTKTVFVKTEERTPIEGILVKLVSGDEILISKLTDEDGKVELYSDFDKYTEISIEVSDIDGNENEGLFISKTIQLSIDKDFYEVVMTI